MIYHDMTGWLTAGRGPTILRAAPQKAVSIASTGPSNKPTYCQAVYYQPTKDLQCYKHPSYVTTKLQCTQDQQATMTITCQT